MGCQDLHHFRLYTLVPYQADLSSLESQAHKVLLQRGGIVPHRLSNPPTHALYTLGACMSVPLLQSHPFVTKPCGLDSLKRTNPLRVGLRCKAENDEDPDTPQLQSGKYVKVLLDLFIVMG